MFAILLAIDPVVEYNKRKGGSFRGEDHKLYH